MPDDTWKWEDPGCDSTVSDCGYGAPTPKDEEDARTKTDTYTDCTLADAATDNDCVEFWTIPCSTPEYNCFEQIISSSCSAGGDELALFNCYTGFLRGMCAKKYATETQMCNTEIMQRALTKSNGCVPGKRWCDGFQTIMGGALKTECKPWDLLCALKDRYTVAPATARDDYPLLAKMPKSLLTIEEA